MVLYNTIVGLAWFSERSEQGHLPRGWVPTQPSAEAIAVESPLRPCILRITLNKRKRWRLFRKSGTRKTTAGSGTTRADLGDQNEYEDRCQN
jgi:hypothetical protein